VGETIELHRDGAFEAYLVRPPKGTPVKGGLVVIHEIWGLADHIKDVSERFAAQGYLVLAPDLLSRVGITAHLGAELQAIMHSPDDKVRSDGQPRLREAMAPSRSPEFAAWAVSALIACVDYLAAQEGVDGHLAVTGFCFGGSFSFALSSADPRLRAVVPFYGTPPPPTDFGKISAPILAFYGDQDERLMSALPDVVKRMADAGVDFTPIVYEHAGHAFFNDANVHAYEPDAATDSWRRTLEFLQANI
jgi:carboxymethylenebutenolidase